MTAPELFAPAFRVQVNGSNLAADVSKNIVSVEVTTAPSKIDHCSLVLANAFPDLRWTHTSDADLFAEGASVRIEMGYVDNTQMMFDGEITTVAPSFPESGGPTVRIEGLSRLHWLDRGTKLRTFRDVTDSDIVQRIGTEANFTVRADNTQTKHPYIAQCNQTDLAFLRERSREVRYELLAQGKTLVFRKAQEGQGKRYTLVWGSPQKGLSGSDVLPLRSFRPHLNPRRAPSAVTVRGQNPASGEAIAERAGAGDEDASMGGTTAAQLNSKAFNAQPEVVITDRPVASEAEALDWARSEFNRRARKLIMGSGTSIGVPDLQSGVVVELDGLGRFSGPYYVTEATHRISSGGYETTFEVERSSVA
jgi:phage protein D